MENYLMTQTAKTKMFKKRYEKYAVAQAWLTDNALTIPVMASPKETAVSYVSKVLPLALHIL